MSPHGPRDPVAGPDSGPESPYPIKLCGPVVKGFGRGSKELGIPTANIPLSGLSVGGHEDLSSGIYFGWAGLDFRSRSAGDGVDDEGWLGHSRVHPMVMSIGWNPYYKNSVRSVEVHIIHSFPKDFYNAHLALLILGFIRPEYDYVSKEALIDDIRTDIEVAKRSLERPAYATFRKDGYLLAPPAEEMVIPKGEGGRENGEARS